MTDNPTIKCNHPCAGKDGATKKERVFYELDVKVASLMDGEDVEYLEDALGEVLRMMGFSGRIESRHTGNEIQIDNEERKETMNENKFMQRLVAAWYFEANKQLAAAKEHCPPGMKKWRLKINVPKRTTQKAILAEAEEFAKKLKGTTGGLTGA
jgi:hypothetical protein